LFCALVAASTAGVLWQANGAGDNLIDGVRFVTGFALAAATVALFRQHPGLANTLPAVLAGAAAIAVPAPDSAWLAFGLVAAVMRAPHVASAFGRTRDLVDATWRILVSRPLFGVGAGEYARTIPLFLPPSFSGSGGATSTHNLIAIGVELGLLGLGLWLAWIGAGLLLSMRALTIDRRDARLWGATAGVAAFIAAMAVSRPLAFSETAYPFMLQFGLMTGLAGSARLNGAPAPTRRAGWQRAVTALAMAAIAAGALISARQGPIVGGAEIGDVRIELRP
jgi:O-antigen ligase